jgi:hypothetical protein
MKRIFIILTLLFVSDFCFSQQNMPSGIIGQIPDINSTKQYQIQVGAFNIIQNAENLILRLKREGFNLSYEKYLDYTRILMTGIPADQVLSYLIKMKQIGLDEVIIREDSTHYAIAEKWE